MQSEQMSEKVWRTMVKKVEWKDVIQTRPSPPVHSTRMMSMKEGQVLSHSLDY